MQAVKATYSGVALKERVRSGEASIRISEAEIASVHESAEACLSDTSAADAAYSTSQAYADGIANKTVRNGSIHGFNPRKLESEGGGRIVASDSTAARSDVWDSPSTEASRVTASSGALERKTVRSGFAYDINGGGGSAESSERARRLKEELGSVPVTGIEDRVAYRFVKRAFDIVFSAAVLVVFCWLYAIIAILIKVDDPKGPVFFSQERVGKDGGTFRMLKFRSMCVDAEDRLAELRELNEKTGPVFKIAEDPRITRVGKWLRKLSLDELPQFINVLRSDMSIVGPRPALPAEVATYDDYQRQRLLVKPGLTCYWQTRRNRDSITFDEWVDLDLLYIKKCSAWSDLKLIIQTVGVVLTAQGN